MKKKNKISNIIITLVIILMITPADIAYSSENMDLSDILSSDVSEINIGPLFLPSDSTQRSDILAMQLLGLCSGFSEENTQILMETAGLNSMANINYDKDRSDPSHNCAFTIGKGIVYKTIIPESALVIIVRGTDSGEWYSNFDFCPSHSEDALFAENFFFCAEEIFNYYLENYSSQSFMNIVICGHSRGAACANLLGLLFDSYQGTENVYVYTFAAPAVIRSNVETENCDNIFNYINPCDLVPRLPLSSWNFVRAGNDIVLPVDDVILYDKVSEIQDTLFETAPSITSYYTDRHSVYFPGTSSEGITSFELMLMLCRNMIEGDDNTGISENYMSLIDEESDFYPLMLIADELSADQYSLGKMILLQHLPVKYKELIERYISEE